MNGRAGLRALAAGCGAGLVLTATMLALRLRLDAPAFPERVADEALLIIPQALFSAALNHLGFGAKPLLFVAIVAAQLATAVIGGLLYGLAAVALAGRADLTNPVVGGAVGLLLGVGGDLVLLPALGAGSPVADLGWPAATPALALAALPGLAYGLALAVLLRLATPPRPRRDPLSGAIVVARGRVRRRAVVGLLLSAVGALVTIGALRRLVGAMVPPRTGVASQAPPPVAAAATTTPSPVPPTAGPTATGVPAAATAPAPATATPAPTPAPSPAASLPAGAPAIPAGVAPLVTPTAQFYIISKNFLDPDLKAGGWQLAIGGLVGRPRTIRDADLRGLASVTLAATLECISNEAGGDLIGTAIWTGVPLRDLLAGAAPRPEATHVVFTCADDYFERLPLAQALDPATLLVYAMNGTPLTRQHGFPARLLAAGRYGMKSPKWITGIELTSVAPSSYWSQRGWTPDAPVRTFTRIDLPAPKTTLPPRPTVVGGVAYAGERGVSRVEVSVDAGATWREARLEAALSPLTWVRWAIPWEPPGPGTYTLAARAYDTEGAPQASETRKPGPGGATGYGRREVVVVA